MSFFGSVMISVGANFLFLLCPKWCYAAY